MELRSTRRIVTGHDAQGKAVALYDAPLKAIQRSAGGNGMTLCWVTGEFPVDMASAADRAQTKVGVPPPTNGTIFRSRNFTTGSASLRRVGSVSNSSSSTRAAASGTTTVVSRSRAFVAPSALSSAATTAARSAKFGTFSPGVSAPAGSGPCPAGSRQMP